jgi:hypothetical protein
MVRSKKMSKNFWHNIETGIDIPEIIDVLVEIPKEPRQVIVES